MRIVTGQGRRAKSANEGTGNLGFGAYAGLGLGAVGTLQQMYQMPKLEAQALDAQVDTSKDVLERAATIPTRQRLGYENAIRTAERSEQEDASNLATLIDQGMSPEQAAAMVSANRDKRDQAVTNLQLQDDAQENAALAAQKLATDNAYANLAQSELAAKQFDILGAAQAKNQGMFDLGALAFKAEDLMNPAAAGVGTSEKGNKLKHGGITAGPHDHDALNLIISHEDGTPAHDQDGDEMHVTGSEAIIPDYIFDQLMAAAQKGDKNTLFEIFMDEIATEERFQG